MPLTRATVEQVIVSRTGRALVEAGMAKTPDADPSPRSYLADPLATALEWYAIFPADRANPSDAEISLIEDADRAGFLGLVELRTLETALDNMLAQPRSESWEDYTIRREGIATDLQALIVAKRRAWLQTLDSGARAAAMSPVVRGALRAPWRCPTDPPPPWCS